MKAEPDQPGVRWLTVKCGSDLVRHVDHLAGQAGLNRSELVRLLPAGPRRATCRPPSWPVRSSWRWRAGFGRGRRPWW